MTNIFFVLFIEITYIYISICLLKQFKRQSTTKRTKFKTFINCKHLTSFNTKHICKNNSYNLFIDSSSKVFGEHVLNICKQSRARWGSSFWAVSSGSTLPSTTVDSRYLEVEGTLWNTSRYLYFDISDFQNWGKDQSNNQIHKWTC